MNKLTRIMSAPERDRSMQVYLSQARGTVRNGDLLRQAVDRAIWEERKANRDIEEDEN